MAKAKVKPIAKYTCLKCGARFDAPQGSKRQYCQQCTFERVTAGKALKGG